MHWVVNFESGKGPSRVNHANAAIGPFIYSFGGYSKESTLRFLEERTPIDVHILNTCTYKWSTRSLPAPGDAQYSETPFFRYGHSCCVYMDVIYLWGGRADWENSFCNSLFAYQPKKHIWSRVEVKGPLKPDGHDGHSACVIKDAMYIFGGFAQTLNEFSDNIYEFSFLASTWTLLQPQNDLRPHCRDFHTASVHGTTMYIFGGRMDVQGHVFSAKSIYTNDVFAYDTVTNQWSEVCENTDPLDESILDVMQLGGGVADIAGNSMVYANYLKRKAALAPGPCGRRSHTAVVHGNRIIIFGGYRETEKEHFNDLFEFNLETRRWRTLNNVLGQPPSERRRAGCCLIDDRMFIFGGTGPHLHATSDDEVASQLSAAAAELLPALNLPAPGVGEDDRPFVANIVNFLARLAANFRGGLPPAMLIDQVRIVPQQQQEDMDVDEDDELELDDFVDSDHNLTELSDLHVLDLTIPSLRMLSIICIRANGLDYSSLPATLKFDIDALKPSPPYTERLQVVQQHVARA